MAKDHYVPQMLLRTFSSGGSKNQQKVWFLTKSTGEIRNEFIKKIAHEHDMYLPKHEEAMKDRENAFGPVLRELCKHRSVKLLKNNEQRALVEFVAAQLYRTKAIRDGLAVLLQTDVLVRRQYCTSTVPTSDDVKTLHATTEASVKILADALLLTKSWILFACPNGCEFVMADQPVVMQIRGPLIDAAVAIKEGAFEMALGPDLLIVFWPPQNVDDGSPIMKVGC